MLDVIDHRQTSQTSNSNSTLPNLNIKLTTSSKLSNVSTSNHKLNKIASKLETGREQINRFIEKFQSTHLFFMKLLIIFIVFEIVPHRTRCFITCSKHICDLRVCIFERFLNRIFRRP